VGVANVPINSSIEEDINIRHMPLGGFVKRLHVLLPIKLGQLRYLQRC